MPTAPANNVSLRAIHLKGDRIMTALCWALWFVSLGFAFLYGTWLIWAVFATFLAATATILNHLIPGKRGCRIGISLVLMGFAILTIDQAHGAIESHFAIFALIAILLYYRDRLPILVAASTICLHHLLFCWLEMNGYPVFLFSHDHVHNLNTILVHAGYVAFEAAMLIYLARALRDEAFESSAIANFGERIGSSGVIDLSFDAAGHRGAAARGLVNLLKAIDQVTRHSASLATRITRVSEGIATSSGRMARMGDAQTLEADAVFDSVRQMSEAGSRIRANCADVAHLATQSATIVARGCETIHHTAELMQTVSRTAGGTVEEIRNLQTESARIQSIVGIMNDIAGQSGLLALNASIEAARAGEKGRGFNVVALEIRTLSERAHQSLAEVQSIVDTINTRVDLLHAQAESCQSAADLGGSQVKQTHASLAEVARHLPTVAERFASVVVNVDDHADLCTNVLAGTTRIREAIQQNQAETATFANLSKSLEQMSGELSANVSLFQHARPSLAPAA